MGPWALSRGPVVLDDGPMTPTTIFVPLDGSERAETALRVADDLAWDLDAELVIVTSTFTRDTSYEEGYLDRALTMVRSHRARSELLSGRFAAQGIVEAAGSAPGGLICMSTHGRSALATVLLGSVANDVVARSEVPVILVGPSCDPTAGRHGDVVTCVSGADEPARTIGVGVALARDLDVRLRVATVVDPHGAPDGRADDVGRRLEAVLKAFGHDAVEHQMAGDDPAERILSLSETFHPRLLVVGRYVDRERYGRPVGRVASELVARSRCPLVVVPAMYEVVTAGAGIGPKEALR